MKTDLEKLEKLMERRWYALAEAEQRNHPQHEIDEMYRKYISALKAYMAAQSVVQMKEAV